MRIYLDNAATTSLSREVFQAMEPYLFENFGNPSSSHACGRTARLAIEESRATIADLLHTSPAQLIFTSGGTEADNTAIISAIRSNGIKVAVTSPLEHHAVLHTLEYLKRNNEITLIYLKPDENGNLSTAQLTQVLEATERAFVSVMHGNNEIGNLNNIEEIGEICYRYNAIFHTDTVQTMGHYKYDTRELKADFLVGSAHKFHGPKGIGFLYKSNTDRLIPLINGGAQEKGQRSGTENVAGIVGLAKALTLAYQQRETNHHHIIKLKQKMIKDLTHNIPGIRFNGNSADTELSLPTVLSVVMPGTADGQSPISYLDLHDISVSGGSACNSAASGSHVLTALGNGFEGTTVRFSFGRYNTEEEIDYVVNKLVNLYVRETLGEMSAFC